MPVSGSMAWRNRIFYGKFQVFFKSSTCCSVAAPSYASICHNFCFTKLLALILFSFFSGILLSYHKRINDKVFMIKLYIRSITCFLIIWSLLEYIWHDSHIIILSGDIETNPGPKHSFANEGLKICCWKLNSLSSYMYKTVSLLSTFIFVLSETYLNSETSHDDGNLEIPAYNILRKDHPSKTKHGGVCVYYKNTLSFKLL